MDTRLTQVYPRPTTIPQVIDKFSKEILSQTHCYKTLAPRFCTETIHFKQPTKGQPWPHHRVTEILCKTVALKRRNKNGVGVQIRQRCQANMFSRFMELWWPALNAVTRKKSKVEVLGRLFVPLLSLFFLNRKKLTKLLQYTSHIYEVQDFNYIFLQQTKYTRVRRKGWGWVTKPYRQVDYE